MFTRNPIQKECAQRWMPLMVALFLLAASAVAQPYRSLDGSGNNLGDTDLGAVFTNLLRVAPAGYDDGVETPSGATRPGAREVSNAVVATPSTVPAPYVLTDMAWLWGQFTDHDIDLSDPEGLVPAEVFHISVPTGDPFFDPSSTGTQIIPFTRSLYDPATGTSVVNPREQLNKISTWIDGSNVYGSEEHRAEVLRTFEKGLLETTKTNVGELLPFNEEGLENAGGPSASLFLAGDVRANENIFLSAVHTLWVREHNRLAKAIRQGNPSLSDEEIYQSARALVGAQMQVITYNEWLPALLGPGAVAPYAGYNSSVDPRISNEFSTASFRFGHSMLSSLLQRVDKHGNTIAEGNISLKDAFFAPQRLINEGGVEPLLRGAIFGQSQKIDVHIVTDVRNFLFGPPGAGGFDLASLNVQRGRDHGLPDYNAVRIAYGLAPKASFADITSDVSLQNALAATYGNVNDIDPWVGGLAEDPHAGSVVGELVFTVLKDQFERLRDGDRFFYRNIFSGPTLAWLEDQTLARVIRRNTKIADEIPDEVFLAP